MERVEIVRRLQELSPWTCSYGGGQHHRGPCFFCGVEPAHVSLANEKPVVDITIHEPDCLWQKARSLTPTPMNPPTPANDVGGIQKKGL